VSHTAVGLRARPAAFLVHWPSRLAWIGLGLYVLYAAGQVNVSWDRIVSGMPQAANCLAECFRLTWLPTSSI